MALPFCFRSILRPCNIFLLGHRVHGERLYMEQIMRDKFSNEQGNGFWEIEERGLGRNCPKEAPLRVIADVETRSRDSKKKGDNHESS
jgi:hypothetical protein